MKALGRIGSAQIFGTCKRRGELRAEKKAFRLSFRFGDYTSTDSCCLRFAEIGRIDYEWAHSLFMLGGRSKVCITTQYCSVFS